MLVSSFASNIHRMQAIDVAVQVGRKVCVVGRSVRKNLNIARNLDYVRVPEDTLVKPNELDDLRPDEVLILCSGSQGEPLSALTRIAYNDHPAVRVERGDTIISARPIPGNELRIHDTINGLAKLGAEVLHEENAAVHVRPRPRRGVAHDDLAAAAACGHARARRIPHARRARPARPGGGVPANAIVLAENGTVVELDEQGRASQARSRRASRSWTDSVSATSGTSPSGTSAICPRTAC